jgi:hypothetical protein
MASVRDSRVHNYPPRWNVAPSQELLVIRRNHKTGEASLDPLRWSLICLLCQDPTGGRKPIDAKCETVHSFRDAFRNRRYMPIRLISPRMNSFVASGQDAFTDAPATPISPCVASASTYPYDVLDREAAALARVTAGRVSYSGAVGI